MTGPDLPPPGSIPSYPGTSQPQPANPAPQPPPAYQPAPMPGAPPPMPSPGGNKKSPWPWILGGCGGCLVLIIIGLIVLGVIGYTARKVAKQSVEVVAPPGMISFTNELSNTPEPLKQYYSKFSFQYPGHFNRVPDEANFVKVEEEEEGF